LSVNPKSETFIEDGKSQEQLEEELGVGVEKAPPLPPKPKLEKVNLDLTSALDIKSIVDEITKLPDSDKASAATKKYNDYEAVAKKIWVIKQSDRESFDIRMRIKDEEASKSRGKTVWKRDKDGKIEIKTKKFYYTPTTRQETDELFKLLSERQSITYEIQLESERITNLSDKKGELTEEEKQTIDKKKWIALSHDFFLTNQNYYLYAFQAYFGATDEELDSLLFDDIMNYAEVAMYKEGVRSPQSDVL
jgi:hypothetical protein